MQCCCTTRIEGQRGIERVEGLDSLNKVPSYEGVFDWELWRMARVTCMSVLLRFAV